MSDKSKLSMAVHTAVQGYRDRLRQWMGNMRGSSSIDDKRPRAWEEYGFPVSVEFNDFYSAYRRRGLAFGAVDKLVSACWSTAPWIIEGDPDDESESETTWEAKVTSLLRPRFWKAVEEADRFRLAARFSALILHFSDGLDWNQPVKIGAQLVKMTPAWQSALRPTKYNDNRADINFGQPIEWQYTESAKQGAGNSITVHADRVFILGDWRDDAIGFLEPVFNNLINVEKVEGGSGESFLKNAARQLSVSFDKEVDLRNIASTYGVEMDELHEKFNEATRDLNRGLDMMLINQGAQVSTLTSEVPDPKPTFDVNLQVIACGLDIPAKILVGMQTGERASSEDQKYFDKRCQARRVKQLSFEVEDLVRHLIRVGFIEAHDDPITVMWTDLTEQTGADKLANAKTMAEINAASQASGEQVFEGNELRAAAGFEPAKLKPLPDDKDPEDEEETLPGEDE